MVWHDACEVDYDNDDEVVDARVHSALESLNIATKHVNDAERNVCVCELARNTIFDTSSKQLMLLKTKLGKCVDRAQPYFHALAVAKQTQLHAMHAAERYEEAQQACDAAKDAMAIADEHLFRCAASGIMFDVHSQDALNAVSERVNVAERRREDALHEHQHLASLSVKNIRLVETLSKQQRRSINRAKPYFQLKLKFEFMRSESHSRVVSTNRVLQTARSNVKKALAVLENLSHDIHMQRHLRRLSLSDSNLPSNSTLVNLDESISDFDKGLPQDLNSSHASCKTADFKDEESEDMTNYTNLSLESVFAVSLSESGSAISQNCSRISTSSTVLAMVAMKGSPVINNENSLALSTSHVICDIEKAAMKSHAASTMTDTREFKFLST